METMTDGPDVALQALTPLQTDDLLAVGPDSNDYFINLDEGILVRTGHERAPAYLQDQEQLAWRERLQDISRMVGVRSGSFRRESGYQAALEEIRKLDSTLQLLNAAEVGVALRGMERELKRRRMQDFVGQIAARNADIRDLSRQHELWVRLQVPEDPSGFRAARLRRFYMEGGEEAAKPAVILTDRYGRVGLKPAGSSPAGLYAAWRGLIRRQPNRRKV